MIRYSRHLCAMVALAYLVMIVHSSSHTCWVPPPAELKFASLLTSMNSTNRFAKNLRITASYTDEFMKLANIEEIKEKVVKPAMNFWSEALKVKHPPGGPLKIARNCIGGMKVVIKQEDGTAKDYCFGGCAAVTKCYDAPVPAEFLDKCEAFVHDKLELVDEGGPGAPDSDYLLLIDSRRYPQCDEGTLAFASVCQLDETSNRPILGYINFCPQKIYLSYPQSIITKVAAVHELGHAFGFTPTMFAYMRDEEGNPRTPRKDGTGEPALGKYSNGIYVPSSATLAQVNRQWVSARGTSTQTRIILKTPNVMRVAQQHFGCASLDGVELENQGGAGTSAAHFEKRIVLNEAMSGSVGFDARLSNLTLAFFEDSGWYTVDWSKAENYEWAKNAGCDFLYKSCYEYMQNRAEQGKSPWPWCADFVADNRRCIAYDNAYGTCNLRKMGTPFPEVNQYFADVPGQPQSLAQFYGGTDTLADFCPYSVPYLGSEKSPSSYCGHLENQVYEDQEVNLEGQSYGSQSRCFDHDSSAPWHCYQCQKVYQYPKVSATCHRFQCIPDQGLIVTIGKKDFVCPVNGGNIRIDSLGSTSFIAGGLKCPACSTVCQNCPGTDVLPRTNVDSRPNYLPCPKSTYGIPKSQTELDSNEDGTE